MVNPENGQVIVFNGEIYNYLELRSELETLGYHFQTFSDTEVILKAYAHWREACLSRFNGMWAFAIYDPKTGSLFCSRDRYGVKPFVYGFNDQNQFVFASEHKALCSAFKEFRAINRDMMRDTLNEGMSFTPYQETLYQRIFHLLPGHWIRLTPGDTTPVQHAFYQIPQELIQPDSLTIRDAQEKFEFLLKDAIKLRFRSDVPVGACLSGGLDSSTLVGLMLELFPGSDLKTFSCIYPDYPLVDESTYINENIQYFGVKASVVQPSYGDNNILDEIKSLVWQQDFPIKSASPLSQREVMRIAKQGGVTVLIDGQGADEVLGGYFAFFSAKRQALLRELLKKPFSNALWNCFQEFKVMASRNPNNRIPIFKTIKKILTDKDLTFNSQGFESQYHSSLSIQKPYPMDDLNNALLDKFRISLIDLLHYEDRNSMTYALESRLPYLDYRIVDFLFSLPHEYKIHKAITKRMMKPTAKRVLPEKVYNRTDKMGFSTPGQNWLRQRSLREYGDYLLGEETHDLWQFINPKVKERFRMFWRQCQADQQLTFGEESKAWQILTSAIWLEQKADSLYLGDHCEISGQHYTALKSVPNYE